MLGYMCLSIPVWLFNIFLTFFRESYQAKAVEKDSGSGKKWKEKSSCHVDGKDEYNYYLSGVYCISSEETPPP